VSPDAADTRAPGQIIAVANQKGGVGKTTTAINLGTALAAMQLRVLLVDMDPQGNASTGLGIKGRDRKVNTYDLLLGDAPLETVCTGTRVPGLDICPANGDLSSADVALLDDPHRLRRLRRALREADDRTPRGGYDYVIIDCPPSLNVLTLNALVAAHAVLVPLQCEFFAMEGLTQIMDSIRKVQRGQNPELRVLGIVLTMFDRRNNLSADVAAEVREIYSDLVYETVIPRNVRLSEAPSHEKPALIYDPYCPGSHAYVALAGELRARRRIALAQAG